MKLLYVGNYRHDFCTEVHIARDLEALGHEVDRLQEPPGGGTMDTLREIERRADGCALLLWTRTWGLPDDATYLWRHLEARGTMTASYHLDLYYGLARQAAVGDDPFWRCGYVFTPDGNESSAEWFAAQGINHHWSPPAVVSDECATVMPGRYREEFAHDVVFVGTRGWPDAYHEEWPWRTELLAWLQATYGDRFRRYSGDTRPGPIRGQDLNDLYASAKVVVGDSCFAHPNQRYWSDRPFETYGRGGFMVFPWITELARMIGAYPSYTVGDFDQLRFQIELGLEDQAWRKQTVEFLETHIARHHTYRQRLKAALEVMGLG